MDVMAKLLEDDIVYVTMSIGGENTQSNVLSFPFIPTTLFTGEWVAAY